MMLVADSGVGKTYILLHIGLCLASKKQVFGEFDVNNSYRVAYIDEELAPWELARRLIGIGAGLSLSPRDLVDLPFFVYNREAFTFDPGFVELVDERIRKSESTESEPAAV